MAKFLGVDTGGTFTDFVYYDGKQLRVHKVLSTPAAPERAILAGLAALDIDPRGLQIVHGSTVATNAVLQGRGVRTAFITNHGFADLLSIGRQARARLYDLQPPKAPCPVPPEWCFETAGRLDAQGHTLTPLAQTELAQLLEQVRAAKPQAVAVCLLFSYLDDRDERRIADALGKEVFVSRSADILPAMGEYERAVATWLNAWVGPLMQGYLSRLQEAVAPAWLSVMQSAAGTMQARQAGERAVNLLLSGPAGGLMAVQHLGQQIGQPSGQLRLLSFDMGGTSTDVALLDGEVALTHEGRIGDYPVHVPMVEMHTIGAGGGSIATVDAGGLLQVGPQSAGADPGPACYGRGGRAATVTDANLVLGRLRADAFLGGDMALDEAAARAALVPVAEQMQCSVKQAAAGIIRLANEHMSQALRVISVERGVDPRQFTLVSFGGAGGLHVCALAESLQMRHALVPAQAGVLSALGMIVAPRLRTLSASLLTAWPELDETVVERQFTELDERARVQLQDEGVAREQMQTQRVALVRYRGQSYSLAIPWQGVGPTHAAFAALHEQRYGHALAAEVELVSVQVHVRSPSPMLQGFATPPPHSGAGPRPAGPGHARIPSLIPSAATEVRTIERAQVPQSGPPLRGPALIVEALATTYITAGWSARRDRWGHLHLTREGGA